MKKSFSFVLALILCLVLSPVSHAHDGPEACPCYPTRTGARTLKYVNTFPCPLHTNCRIVQEVYDVEYYCNAICQRFLYTANDTVLSHLEVIEYKNNF